MYGDGIWIYGDAEGKHHLYFFPSTFKIIKIHEKVKKQIIIQKQTH